MIQRKDANPSGWRSPSCTLGAGREGCASFVVNQQGEEKACVSPVPFATPRKVKRATTSEKMPSAKRKPMVSVAALYVEPAGPYAGLDGVDCWHESRDARTYAGPHPVVAHPPCARWSRLAVLHGRVGEDEGCFATALSAVRNYGGVLEHPEQSRAWRWYGLIQPPSSGGWVWADWDGGWTCRVDQRHYGHRARKPTWLYAVGCELPSIKWGDGPMGEVQIGSGYARSGLPTMPQRERRVTPEPFRDLLLSMARSVTR